MARRPWRKEEEMSGEEFDAVVVGSGRNGLSAAITPAEAGRRVLIMEGADSVGGGARSGNLTGDDLLHDIGSAVHPLGVAPPVFGRWPLHQYGFVGVGREPQRHGETPHGDESTGVTRSPAGAGQR
jgi:phytoene dehydrogenase-like protein